MRLVTYVTAVCAEPGCSNVLGNPPKETLLGPCRSELVSFACTDAISATCSRNNWKLTKNPRGGLGFYCPEHSKDI